MSKLKLDIAETGKLGREIYNEIVNGLTHLVPKKGSITIKVKLDVQDKTIFKDLGERETELIIFVELGEK